MLSPEDAVRLLPAVAHRIELLEPVLRQAHALPATWSGADPFLPALESCSECFDALVRAGTRPGAELVSWVAEREDVGVLRRVLATGVDVDGEPAHRPLAAAAACQFSGPMVAALLAAGADPTLPGPHGAPLQVARDPGVVHLLVAAGARVDHAAFASAVRSRCAGCLQVLLATGADPDTRSSAGVTPLMLAAVAETDWGGGYAGAERLLDALLDAGASKLAKDAEGRTAADHALAAGRPALAARLRP